jgi:hypothetical protein
MPPARLFALVAGTCGFRVFPLLSSIDKRGGEYRSVEYGGSWRLVDYEDLNRAMIKEASQFIPALMEQAAAKSKATDLSEAQRLAAKHGFQIEQG